MNRRIRDDDKESTWINWFIWITQLTTLALVLYLGHLVIGISDYVHNQRPISNITTDYVIINDTTDEFDIVETR